MLVLLLTVGVLFATGELTLKLPPFVEVSHDESLGKANVSVLDPSIPHQRAMWGMFKEKELLLMLADHCMPLA